LNLFVIKASSCALDIGAATHGNSIMAEQENPFLQCESCGGTMTLARTTPKIGTWPELQTFRCDSCEHVVTRERAND